MLKKIFITLIMVIPSYSRSIYNVSCYLPDSHQYLGNALCREDQTVADCCNQAIKGPSQLYYSSSRNREQEIRPRRTSPQKPAPLYYSPSRNRELEVKPRRISPPQIPSFFNNPSSPPPSTLLSSSPTEKFLNWIKRKSSDPPRSSSPQPSSSGSLSSLDSMSPRTLGGNMVRVSCIARSDILKEAVPLAVIRCAEGGQEHYQKECEKACSIKAVKFSD